MFTFGIFTTHLPYIAFVVFYAYFLLFGMNSVPVTEENQVSESKFRIELQTSKSLSDADSGTCYHYRADFDLSKQADFEESIFRRKLNHQCCQSIGNWQYIFSNSLFCRPPPLFI